jgi:hypothetical protein
LSATTQAQPTNITILGSWLAGTTHAKETGTNRALIFYAFAEKSSSYTLNSVTYGGQTMTKIIDAAGGTTTHAYVAAYILKDAGITAATTTTFTPSWSTTPSEVSYESVFLSNVDQTTSIGASDSTVSSTSTPNPITTDPLATNDGDMAMLGATCGNTCNYTVNNGFAEAIENDMASSTGTAGYKSAIGVNETPSVTSSSVNRQAIIGFVVKAAAVVVDDPPVAPTGLAATAGNNMVSLNWNDNSESDLDGYNIYRSTTQGSGYGKLNVALLSTSDYVDSTVNNGTPYYYVVTAVDANGHESGNSSEAGAIPWYQTCADVWAGGDGLESDLNIDCHVDYEDLEIIVNNWLADDCAEPDNCGGADFEPTDGNVDLADFGTFAEQWLECNDPAGCGPPA